MKHTLRWLAVLLIAACSEPTRPEVSSPLASLAAATPWAATTSLATPRSYLGSVTDAAGLVYAIAGLRGATALTSVERFDPANTTWSTLAATQFPHQSGAVAMGANAKIYVFGGGSSVFPRRVEEYDVAANTWSSVTDMQTTRAFFGAATGADGKIWVIGGYSGTTHLNVVEAYDPATDTWYAGPAMPTPRSRLSVATGTDGRIYAMGGTDGIRALNIVEALDPQTLTWSPAAPMNVSRLEAATTVTADGRIYLIGGNNFGTPVSTLTEYFDPAINTWVVEPALTVGRRLLGATTGADGRLYAIGGAGAVDTAVGTVEVMTPSPVTTVSIQMVSSTIINPNLPDTVRVAVLGSATFLVSNVVNASIVFGGAARVGTVVTNTGVVNGDAFPDRTFKFIATTMTLPIGTSEACMGGTASSVAFKGCTAVSLSATGRVWAAIPSMSTARFAPAAVTGNDGRVYVFGGLSTAGAALATAEVYDPTTGVWSSIASMPTARFSHAAVKGSDGRLYVFGGTDGTNPLNTVIRYDVALNTWTARTNMAATRDGVRGALASNNAIYVFGGTNDVTSNAIVTCASYNTTTNAWGALACANMAQRRFDHAAATGSDGRLYVIGGWATLASVTALTSVAAYNATANTWANRAALPAARAGLGAAADATTIYAVGGNNGLGAVQNTTYSYSVSGNTWSVLRAMNSDRDYPGVAIGLDGKVYAIGGSDGANYLLSAEVFATQFNSGVPLVPLN